MTMTTILFLVAAIDLFILAFIGGCDRNIDEMD